MKTKWAIALLILISWALPWENCLAVEPAHLAIVVSTQGEGIRVKRYSQNDLESPIKIGMKLFDKDTVITPPASTCSIMFNTGNLVKVSANSRLTVNMRPMDANTLTSISRKLAEAFFTEDPQEDNLQAVGGMRSTGKDAPRLLFPKESTIANNRPAFQWSLMPGAKKYVVTLTSVEDNLWTRETDQPRLEYPSDLPPLAPGISYFWQVDVVYKDTRRSSEPGSFDIAGKDVLEEIENIRKSLASENLQEEMHVILAKAYQRHNMLHEAIEECRKTMELNPKSSYPHEQLGDIYWRMGWTDQAIGSFLMASRLDPVSMKSHQKLAVLYHQTGEQGKAKQEEETASRMALSPRGMNGASMEEMISEKK